MLIFDLFIDTRYDFSEFLMYKKPEIYSTLAHISDEELGCNQWVE